MSIKSLLMLLMLIALISFLFDVSPNIMHKKQLKWQHMVTREIDLQRDMLLNQADVIDINWLHSLNAKVLNVQGRMIWSSVKQLGIASFTGLPQSHTSQSYFLWAYDLEGSVDEPVLLKNFSVLDKKPLAIKIRPHKKLKNPYKFELFLSNDPESNMYPLLLAQP